MPGKFLKYHLLIISYVLGSYIPAFSQAKSEQDLVKQGNKLFYEQNYSAASPYFLQLLSLNQTNPEYNYKYGTCLLFSDGDKNKPLKYLLFAVTKSTSLDKEAYYYAARALHLNYRFGEAIKYYQKYAGMAEPRDKEKYQVDRQIEMCNNGKKLLRNVTDLIVVSKKDYREADFFRLYDAKQIEGKILVAEELQSSTDKKREHRVVINLPRTSDIVYFSSYGDDGKSLDIYRVKRLPGNGWSKPQLVKGGVNTAYDEDYPYLHPDGRSLYFCSKGHNSMGGYDIFRSTFDPETETFGPPENLDFAVNTPDDDILYILDSLEQSAYFASKRESGIGKVHVYNVRVERLPVLIAILKGRFINEVTPGSNGATITVQDMASNEAVGIFNAKTGNGDYLITLDKSGKYKYLVKCEGKPEVYEAIVDIPYQKEIRPLKQEIALVNREGKEVLVIRNMFDQNVENADEIIAEVYKNKASLNPNAESIPDSVLQALQNKGKDSVVEVAINENLTNEDLIKMAKEQAENQQKEADELNEKLEAAYNVAAQKTEDARQKAKEAENSISQGDEIIDPLEKGMLYDEAKKLNDEADKSSKEAVVALNLAKSLEGQADKAKKDAAISKKYADDIEKAINSKNKQEAIKQLKEQQAYIKSLMSANSSQEDLYAETKRKAGEKREEARKAMATADKFRQSEAEYLSDISAQKKEAENAKGKKKEEIEQKIKDMQAELADVQKKKQDAFDRSDKLNKEADQLDSQAEMLAGILENPDINPSKVLTQTEKDQLANNIQSQAQNVENNNNKIEQKTQVDRQKKFDYNDFLAKYDYYANMFNEYERLKRSLTTPEDYDRLINHNSKWIDEIDTDLASIEKDEKTADENKKKQLAAKREQLKQLKQLKQQENKDLAVERQKLIDRLANKTNNDNNQQTNKTVTENLASVDNNKVKDAAQKNQDKIKEIDNSDKTVIRKAIEKNKADRDLVKELNDQIEKEKKVLATSTDENEKEKSRKNLKVFEEAKNAKEKEIADNNDVVAKNNKDNTDTELLDTYSDRLRKSDALGENPEIKTQADKTNVIKEELDDLIAKRSETTDETQRKELEKKIKDKSLALYTEEEKLATSVKTENDKIYTKQKTKSETWITDGNLADGIRMRLNQLAADADKAKQEADVLYTQAKNEKDPVKRNNLLEQAVDKQNQALQKQQEAQELYENSKNNKSALTDTTPLTEEQKKQVANTVDKDFSQKENNILSSNKTEAEKNKELKTLNEDLVNKVKTEITSVQNGNLPANEKKDRIEQLNRLVEAKQKDIVALDKKLQGDVADNSNPNNALTKTQENQIAETVDGNFGKKEKEIQNSGKSEEEKNKELKVLNENLVNEVKSELNSLQNTGTENLTEAEKQRRKMRLEELNRLLDAKQKEIADLNKKLQGDVADNSNPNNHGNDGNNTDNLNQQQKDQITESVDGNFNKKEKDIQNSGKSEEEKTKELKVLNENLANEVKSELTSLQNSNTDNLTEEEKQRRKMRIEELNRLLDAKQKDIAALDKKLQEQQSADNATNTTYAVDPTNYNSTEAQQQLSRIKDQLETIQRKTAEIAQLKNQLTAATNNNDKQSIQNKIDQEQKKLTKTELEVAPVFERINAAEIKNNQTKINDLLAQMDSSKMNAGLQEAYNKAKQLQDQADKSTTQANQLRQEAKNEKDENKRNELLKKANRLESDAIRDQQEAQKTLATLLNQYKESLASGNPDNSNSPNNANIDSERDQQLINEVSTDYNNKLKEIRNSNQSEARKTFQENELNKDLVNKLQNELVKIQQTNPDNLSEAEKQKRKLRIEELNRLLDAKQKTLDQSEQKLRAENIIADNTQNSGDYNTTLLIQDQGAQAEKQKIDNQLKEIKKEKDLLAENKLKQKETTDEKEKQKLEKEAAAISNRIDQKEIAIAPSIDRINNLEFTAHKNNLAQKQLKLAENGNTLSPETEKQVNQLTSEAENLNREADQLREQAKKESDPAKKNNLFKQAHEKEVAAILNIVKAEQLVDEASTQQQSVNVVENKSDNDRVLNSVDNVYAQNIKDIEASNESPLHKTQRKENLNEELVNKIRTEIATLEKDLSKQTPEEQERRKLRLAELNRLLDQKVKELKAQRQLLASNGVTNNGNQDVSYTDPYNVENPSARSLQLEAKQRIDELKREEAKLKDAQIKAAEANNASDKIKFQNEAKNEEKLVTEKELNVAKVFTDINALEIADNKTELQKLQSRLVENKRIDKNSEKALLAENKVDGANQKLKEAADLRNQANNETDKTKKNSLQKAAFAKEKEAIQLQNEAEALYEEMLGDAEVASIRSNGNPDNRDNTDNITLPEDPGQRPSARALRKYEELTNRANYLEQRYKTVSDSAQTVKKKNRPEVLAMADRLKKESEAARTEANLAKNNYESLKQQEDEQLAQQQKRKAEQENARQLEPEVAKMNEYANYYALQKEANDLQAQIDRNKKQENEWRDKATEQKAEAFNLRQDADRQTDANKKQEILNKADQLDQQAVRNLSRADSIATLTRPLETRYNEQQRKADDFLATVDPIKADKIRNVVGEKKMNLVKPEVEYVAGNINNGNVSDPVAFARNFKAPNEVKNDIYVKSNVAAYNKDNPIPINTAPPKGIYFKVQVGAFRNPIPQDLFKEFVPITGETTDNGITRYTVGYFTQFKTADDAKREIRGFGEQYKDAFVVGFQDGKRISVAEALRLLNEQPALANNNQNNGNNNGNNNQNNANNQGNNGNNNQNNNGNNNTNNNQNANNNANVNIDNAGNEFNNFKADNSKTNYYSETPNAAKANQVEVIKGLFYTVQVGVYSKPVSLDKIYNIQPLNSELTATRKIRYTTGVYTDMDRANVRKNEARAAGITDAFVTAYFNGKRITIDEARQLVEKYGKDIFANPTNLRSGNGNVVNGNNGNVPNNNNQGNNVNNSPVNNNPNNDNNNPGGNVNNTGPFTVILGEYTGDIPSKDAEVYIKNSNQYRIMKTNRNGKSTYFVEAPKGKAEADQISNYFKSQGLTKTNVINAKLTGEVANNNAVKVLEPKKQNGLKFQVYLGEYIDEVPEDDALIYLNNVDKGVKRKVNPDGYTIYYTCDCESYDDALKSKAYFVQEGITSVRIVPFLDNKEITMGDAFKLIYE